MLCFDGFFLFFQFHNLTEKIGMSWSKLTTKSSFLIYLHILNKTKTFTFRVHQKEKRHSCQYCDKSFFKMSSKKRHELTHVEHDTWKCKVCSKTFKDQSSLKYHTQKRVCQAKNHAKTDKDGKEANNAANSTRNASSKNQIVLQRGERLVASTILGI